MSAIQQTEGWAAIAACPGYQVSTFGRIKSEKGKNKLRILRPFIGKNYLRIELTTRDGSRRKFFVHRLVASAFVPGEAPGLEVDHIDGDGQHNAPSNLEWVTRKQNAARASRNGLYAAGQRRGKERCNAKLGPLRIAEARRRRGAGESISAIARGFGVHHSTLSRAIRGKTWNGGGYGFEEGSRCNRDSCAGIIGQMESRFGGCSCHNGNAPCSSCTEGLGFCPVCDWEEEDA